METVGASGDVVEGLIKGRTSNLSIEANPSNRLTASILIVEDDAASRRMLCRILSGEGHLPVEVATAAEAKEVLKGTAFPMALLDMNLPDESGLSLLADLTHASPDTACIMVTGEDSRELGEAATVHGAYGYIIKPFSANELLISVSNGLRRQALEHDRRLDHGRLERAVSSRTRDLWETNLELARREEQLRLANRETVERLALAAEFRDDDTARHVTRVSEYCALLAKTLEWGREDVVEIRLASILHDVGKIGVPDDILRKPGKLTPDERSIMELHAGMGGRILAGSESQLLKSAAVIALTHHERWDGAGYPRGLTGIDIPLSGRITAVADVFDALTTDRVYRKAFSIPQALSMMNDGRGSHFDPDVLDAFLGSIDEVLAIRDEYDG